MAVAQLNQVLLSMPLWLSFDASLAVLRCLLSCPSMPLVLVSSTVILIAKLDQVVTARDLHPAIELSLESSFGLLHLPDKDDEVTKIPTHPSPNITLRGSTMAVTVSLATLQYQVDHARYPNFNTQTKGRPGSDVLRLVYDKSTATQGMADPNNMGAVTVFDFPVSILATNDAPTIIAPDIVSCTRAHTHEFVSLPHLARARGEPCAQEDRLRGGQCDGVA